MRRLPALQLLVLLAATLLVAGSVVPGRSTDPASAEYSASVGPESVSVSIHLNMVQNLTAFEESFTLPTFHRVIDESNSTGVTAELQRALQLKTPKAQVSGLRLEAASTPWSNQSRAQLFNVSLAFVVGGVSTTNGGVTEHDLSWKSFAISSSVALDGIEINQIGSSYLLDVAEKVGSEAQSSSPLVRTSFHVNGRTVTGPRLAEAVQDVSSLNFSSLSPQISAWQRSEAPFSNEIIWSLDPGKNFGVDISVSITEEPGVSATTIYGVLYQVVGEITAPRRSSANGNTITVIPDDSPEILMEVTILSASSIGLITFFYERRVVGKRPARPKLKRR